MPVCVSCGKLIYATDPSVDDWLKLMRVRGDYVFTKYGTGASDYVSIGGRVLGICIECQQRHRNTNMSPHVRAILSDGADYLDDVITIA